MALDATTLHVAANVAAAKSAFEELGYNYSVPKPGLLRAGWDDDEATFGTEYVVFVQISDDGHKIVTSARSDYRVPEEARARVAQLLAIVNYDMTEGSYELDFGDGETIFRVGFIVSHMAHRTLSGTVKVAVHSANSCYTPIMNAVKRVADNPNVDVADAARDGLAVQKQRLAGARGRADAAAH